MITFLRTYFLILALVIFFNAIDTFTIPWDFIIGAAMLWLGLAIGHWKTWIDK